MPPCSPPRKSIPPTCPARESRWAGFWDKTSTNRDYTGRVLVPRPVRLQRVRRPSFPCHRTVWSTAWVRAITISRPASRASWSVPRRPDLATPSNTTSNTTRISIASKSTFASSDRPLRDRLDLQPNGTWVRNATASQLKTFLHRTADHQHQRDVQSAGELHQSRNVWLLSRENFQRYVRHPTRRRNRRELQRWSWGGRFKAGGLFNFADRRSLINATLSGIPDPTRDEHISSENLAVVLEGGLLATYQVRPNLLARVAYDAMYVQGIATATENLSLADAFPKFEVTGDSIFHGLSVGFEMLW